jgi:hypothetical protein
MSSHRVEKPSSCSFPSTVKHGPLSLNQQALWFASKLDATAYNLVYGFRLLGLVEPVSLRRALALLVVRHCVLRTTFVETEQGPRRVVHPRMDFEFRCVETNGLDEPTLLQRLYADAARPYDLECGPVLRCVLYPRGSREHVLLMATHHLSLDGGSLILLIQELQRISADLARREAPTPVSEARDYDNFVQWQEQWLDSTEGVRVRDWWRRQLAGCTPLLHLPTDHPRHGRQTFAQHTHLLRLDDALASRLVVVAKAEGTNPYALMLAVFQLLLHRHSGQEDLLVGVPSSGRAEHWARPGLVAAAPGREER